MVLEDNRDNNNNRNNGRNIGCHEVTYNTDNGITSATEKLSLLLLLHLCCLPKTTSKNRKKKNSSTRLKRQPAFRLVKVVFVVVNRQHGVQNQTVVPVVSVVVKREGG